MIGSFVASLALPTLVYPAVRSHLDQQNYENRKLASFPDLSIANFDNIPTEFEAYYNDHVPFKNLFVKAKTKLDLELLNESSISEVTVTTVDMNEDNSFAVFESDSPNDKILLVVGDSFSQNLKYFMPKLYRKTVFATFDTYTEALLDEYQPDDFVYLTVERNQELFEDVETVVWRDEVPQKDK